MIIDFHTHILPEKLRLNKDKALASDPLFKRLFSFSNSTFISAEDLVLEMERSQVSSSIVLGYGWKNPDVVRLFNDYALDASRRYPSKIVPFCSVNPFDGKAAVKEIERCVSYGAMGVGELHMTFEEICSGPRELSVFMGCLRSAGLPLLIHASEPVGHIYPGKGTAYPGALAFFVESFPDNRFVLAHFGGGLSFYCLMPEIRRAFRNVWFDSAAFPYLYTSNIFASAIISTGSSRIVFGSDYPLVSQKRALKDFPMALLSDQDAAMILGGNARSLLDID